MKSQIIGIRKYSRTNQSTGERNDYISLGLATFDPDFKDGARGETINVDVRYLDNYKPVIGDMVAVQRGEARSFNGRVYQPIEGVILLSHEK